MQNALEHRGRDTHRKIYLLLRGLGAVYEDGERAGREPTLVQRLWCRGPSNKKKIISYSSRIGLPEYHSNLFPRNARIVMKFPDLEFASNNFFRLKHIVTTKNSSCHKIIVIRLRLGT